MASSVLLAIFAVMIGYASAAGECNGCTCVLDANEVDFTPLQNNPINATDLQGQFTYFYTPCNATCSIYKANLEETICIGENGTFQSGSQGSLMYYADKIAASTVMITLKCAASQSNTFLVQGVANGLYRFQLSGPVACPKAVAKSTPNPTTPKATTPKATTPKATTPKPTTPKATTPKPTTPKATTPKPTTPKATTPKPTTPKATTPKPTTPKATTPKATTPKPTTPKATTPKATTPKPTTPKATTPKATTPKPTTPKATTPKATTPKATTPKATTPKATTPKTGPTNPKTSPKTNPTNPKTSPKVTSPAPHSTTPGGGANGVISSLSATALVVVALVVNRLV